jgi:transaldolase
MTNGAKGNRSAVTSVFARAQATAAGRAGKQLDELASPYASPCSAKVS